MTIVSIIQNARKDDWVCIALLRSIRKFQKMLLGLCWSMPSGFSLLRCIEVFIYFNDSIKSISLPRMTPNACISSFITDIALGIFSLLLMPRAIFIFAVGSKNPFVPLTNHSVTKKKYFSLPILSEQGFDYIFGKCFSSCNISRIYLCK